MTSLGWWEVLRPLLRESFPGKEAGLSQGVALCLGVSTCGTGLRGCSGDSSDT